MITFIFPLILTVFAEEAFSKKCWEGLRPHESRKAEEYKKFVDCGVSDKYKQVECKESCYITDFWISGVNDKPLTISSCGRLDEEGLDGKGHVECTPVCEKEVFLQQANLEKVLKKHAADSSKLTDQCLSFLTKIDAISVKKCGKSEEECKDHYCTSKEKHATCKRESSSKPNASVASPSKTDAPVENESSPAVTAQTGNGNKTGNATTSGGASIIISFLSMSYLTITFLMKTFL